MSHCSVKNCHREAEYQVILYDVYLTEKDVFFEQDSTCPLICSHHMVENEQKAEGERKPRGFVSYPYTNQHQAQGFTIYQPIE